MKDFAPLSRDFTVLMACRNYMVLLEGRPVMPLSVEIGACVQDVETVNGTDWRCPVRFTLGHEVTVHLGVGIDSFQALRIAMDRVRWQLERLAQECGYSFSYLEMPVDFSPDAWQKNLL